MFKILGIYKKRENKDLISCSIHYNYFPVMCLRNCRCYLWRERVVEDKNNQSLPVSLSFSYYSANVLQDTSLLAMSLVADVSIEIQIYLELIKKSCTYDSYIFGYFSGSLMRMPRFLLSQRFLLQRGNNMLSNWLSDSMQASGRSPMNGGTGLIYDFLF